MSRLYCTNAHHGLPPGNCLECDLMNERARAEAAEAERDRLREAEAWYIELRDRLYRTT
jgi:hypothetical protein